MTNSNNARRLIHIPFDQIEAQPIEWLWENRIARGKLTVFVGNPGMGKSLMALAVAAALSRGTSFPDGAACKEAGQVLIIADEDDVADTIRPRLDAAQADVKRVHIVKQVMEKTVQGEIEVFFDLTRDLQSLRAAAKDLPSLKLIILDPVLAYMGSANSFRDQEVRSVLTPLVKFASETKIAILGILHLNKAVEKVALQRVGGSAALVAVPRIVWGFDQSGANDKRYVMVAMKNNIKAADSLAYRIEEVRHETFANGQPMIVFEGAAPETKEDLFIDSREERATRGGRHDEACEFLRGELAQGPRASKEMEKEARTRGISPRTLARARPDLGIVSFKQGLEWWMRLPVHRNAEADKCFERVLGGLGVLDETSIENKDSLKNANHSSNSADGILDDVASCTEHNNNSQDENNQGRRAMVCGALEKQNKSGHLLRRTPTAPRMP